MKLFPDALPCAVALKLAEDVVDRRARRKRPARQIPPRAACAQKIEDRIHRCAHIGLARSPAPLRRRDQRLHPATAHRSNRWEGPAPTVCRSPYALASTSRIKASEPSRRRSITAPSSAPETFGSGSQYECKRAWRIAAYVAE